MESSKREWFFLIKICDLFIAKNKVLLVEVPEGLDWDKFIELATHHRVLSIVYDQLGRIDKDVPNYILKQLANYYKARTQFNLTLTSELIILLKLLKEKGLGMIPYKGVLLSHFVYGNLGTRPSADIDIMVRVEELEQIMFYLESKGYELPERYADILHKSHLKNNCELSIKKQLADKELSIDTHWKVANRMLQLNVTYNEMVKESHIVDFFGVGVHFLKPEALVLTTIMHHFGKEKMVHLKQIVDLAMIVKKYNVEIDWDKLEELSKEWKIYRLSMTGLLMVRELLNYTFPDPLDKLICAKGDKLFVAKHLRELKYSKGKYVDDVRNDFSRGLKLHLRLREDFLTKVKVVLFHLITVLRPNEQDFDDPKEVSSFRWCMAVFTKPLRLVKDYFINS